MADDTRTTLSPRLPTRAVSGFRESLRSGSWSKQPRGSSADVELTRSGSVALRAPCRRGRPCRRYQPLGKVCRKLLPSALRSPPQLLDLRKIEQVLDQKDTYLIGLDTSGDATKAILAVGNPDEADHVAVTVPGMGSQDDAGSTIEGMTREGTLMQAEAQTQLERAGRGDETVATVAWMNYDTPPGLLEGAGSDARATGAAPVLSNYLESIDVTSTGTEEPHLTLVGHSYGSLAAGLSLQEGASDVVDDYVAYGSPGFYAMDESQLGMQQGHVFVMQAPDDPIRLVAETPWFGGDPADGSFVQLSTTAGTTPDGVYREGASGHSEYPRPFNADGTDRLRVTGYNTAAVIAGLSETAVRK